MPLGHSITFIYYFVAYFLSNFSESDFTMWYLTRSVINFSSFFDTYFAYFQVFGYFEPILVVKGQISIPKLIQIAA